MRRAGANEPYLRFAGQGLMLRGATASAGAPGSSRLQGTMRKILGPRARSACSREPATCLHPPLRKLLPLMPEPTTQSHTGLSPEAFPAGAARGPRGACRPGPGHPVRWAASL